MNRIQHVTLWVLSAILALSIITLLVLGRWSTYDDMRLHDGSQKIQVGQSNFQRLDQVATRIATLSREKNDQALRDLLERHNIKIRNPGQPTPGAPSTSSAPTPMPSAATPAPSTSTPEATDAALNPLSK